MKEQLMELDTLARIWLKVLYKKTALTLAYDRITLNL